MKFGTIILRWISTFFIVLPNLILAGCTNSGKEQTTKPTQSGDILTRQQLAALVEKLANQNTTPVKVGNDIIREANYDFEEDKRVRSIAADLSKHPSEDLWWCLVDHIEDERYAITFNNDSHRQIATVGYLCWNKACEDLAAPYRSDIPDLYWPILRVVGNHDQLKEWYRQHQSIPLYKQQIEIGEKILEKMNQLQPDLSHHWISSNEDKKVIVALFKKQIDLLQQNKEPILSHDDLIPDN